MKAKEPGAVGRLKGGEYSESGPDRGPLPPAEDP